MFEKFDKHLPKNKFIRTLAGLTLIILGIIGIVLPVLGFWMIPLGLAILALEYAFARTILRKIRDGLTWLRLRLAARRTGRY